MATRENNTMAEGLSKILKDIAMMKMEPDADMEFLGALEGDILTYLKPPTPQPASAQQAQNPMGAMGPAMGAVMGQATQAPNADELRRTLSPS